MDLGLTESQETLKKEARVFLEGECPLKVIRAVDKGGVACPPELWRHVCQQGWLGVVIPEQYGGNGGDFVDLVVLLEEMGRALFPGPFFSTVVLGALPILAFGTRRQKQEFLPPVARGEVVFTGAFMEPWHKHGASHLRAEAHPTESGYSLTGEKLFVPNAESADYLLVPAVLGDSGTDMAVFVVPARAPGLQTHPMNGLAREHDRQLLLKNVSAADADILGGPGSGWAIVRQVEKWGAVGLCAQMLGAAQRLLEMTVEYAKQRVQFGRPIGSFQAIQHHCANMAIDVDSVRYMTYLAAWKLSRQESAGMEVSMTKAWCSKASDRVAALAHQVHGAIAFVEDHAVPLYSRRMKVWALAFGGSTEHEEVVAGHLGL